MAQFSRAVHWIANISRREWARANGLYNGDFRHSLRSTTRKGLKAESFLRFKKSTPNNSQLKGQKTQTGDQITWLHARQWWQGLFKFSKSVFRVSWNFIFLYKHKKTLVGRAKIEWIHMMLRITSGSGSENWSETQQKRVQQKVVLFFYSLLYFFYRGAETETNRQKSIQIWCQTTKLSSIQ